MNTNMTGFRQFSKIALALEGLSINGLTVKKCAMPNMLRSCSKSGGNYPWRLAAERALQH